MKSSGSFAPSQPETIDSKPFSHTGSNGTEFKIDRCDLDATLTARVPKRLTEEQMLVDFLEMSTWHALNIWPKLVQKRSHYIKKVEIVRV